MHIRFFIQVIFGLISAIILPKVLLGKVDKQKIYFVCVLLISLGLVFARNFILTVMITTVLIVLFIALKKFYEKSSYTDLELSISLLIVFTFLILFENGILESNQFIVPIIVLVVVRLLSKTNSLKENFEALNILLVGTFLLRVFTPYLTTIVLNILKLISAT